MESANCNLRASGSEQSLQTYCVPVEYEPVKEEPEWDECGVSEAAAAEGLYAGHQVKDELAIGPELVQQQDIAFSMQNALNIKEENLHETKPSGGADAAPKCTHTCPGDELRCDRSSKKQNGLRSSFVGDLHTCGTCNIIFDCKLSLINHRHVNSLDESTFNMKVSNGTTSAVKKDIALSSHTQKLTGEKPISCGYCDKQFTKNAYLIIHERKHTGEKPYGCDVCNKQFAVKSTLTIHKRIHAGEKPYSCSICNERFMFSSALTSHTKRKHTGEKPYNCQICHRWFTDKSTMINHIRIHTGEKPFSCSICNKRFSVLSALTRHTRIIHTGEKPHGCNICNERFKYKSVLTTHVQMHKAGNLYSC